MIMTKVKLLQEQKDAERDGGGDDDDDDEEEEEEVEEALWHRN